MIPLIATIAAAIFGALSLYGWWFHVVVGPAHGPGAEVGIVAGGLAAAAGGLAWWARRREG